MNVRDQWTPQKKGFLLHEGHCLALGGPGSGKTHVALVKAGEYIRRGALKPGQKVLFLSFARPTVARIIEKATELISSSELRQLDVNTYHGFAWSILRSHGYLLNGHRQLALLPPPEAAAHMATIVPDARRAEMVRLFYEEGRLHFDLFASLVAQIFLKSERLASVYADAYPFIVLDEFQDTNADEWSLIRALGGRSRLVVLADPEQRIYEFRGADPNRLTELTAAFLPRLFDFSGENHRSNGTDITEFGNDLLTGATIGKVYVNVKVTRYGFYFGKDQHYAAKAAVLESLKRLRKQGQSSIAVLVPSKELMLQVSNYLMAESDGLPALRHDVAMDAEAPSLAASMISVLLAGGQEDELTSDLVAAVHMHIRGRNGGRDVAQTELALAGALHAYMGGGKIRGSKRAQVIDECRRLAIDRQAVDLTGSPEGDWVLMRDMLAASSSPTIARIAQDAKYLRLLHRGSALRSALSDLWKRSGSYLGAEAAVRDALVQEHFLATQKDWRGVHLMTIHKSKGKEFDEVVIYEGRHRRIVPTGASPQRYAQARLALRVAVTRAKSRATILTPKDDSCPFV